MPLWMTFFSATVFCFLWIMFTGKETLPILHAGRSMCLYLLWLGLSAAALWGSSSFVGAPTGMVASVSYNAYVTLLCEIPCLLFSWSFLFSFLFCISCTGAVSFFNLYKRYTVGVLRSS